MRKKLLGVFLVLSIAANLAFFGGYVSASLDESAVASEGTAVSRLIERLGLDQDQVASLQTHRGAAAEIARQIAAENDSLVASFWSALKAPEFDDKVLRDAIDAVAERRAALTLDVARELHGFMQDLSDDQLDDFIRLVQRRPILAGQFIMTQAQPPTK